MKYIFLLFILISLNAQNLFEKLQSDAKTHPTVAFAGGCCLIVNDSSEDVRLNYLYYFCNQGSGSWTHYTFYWIHSLNPIIYQEYSNRIFCIQAKEADSKIISSTLTNISKIISC